MQRRVVVTGIGVVSPLGVGTSLSWQKLIQGGSGVGNVHFDEPYAQGIPSKIGAKVDRKEFDKVLPAVLTNKRAQDTGCISMAMVAALEAIQDSGIDFQDASIDPTRAGVAIGSGIGSSVEEVVAAHDLISNHPSGIRKLSPYFVPRLLINMAAGQVSIAHNLQGPNHSCVTACATGAHSIGDASRFIQFDDADIMVAGGTESSMNALSYAGFSRVKALSTGFNDEPEKASRPFDKDRDGFVMGEGAGIVVLEELEHAKKRGARIYAELTGYGLSGDAFHLTAPAEDGKGAITSMGSSIRHAGVALDKIDYINAHATSTPLGDEVESQAIASVFSSVREGHTPAVSSTKGATGHLLGAAGALEAIFTILSVHNGVIPPTINLDNPNIDTDVRAALHFVANTAEQRVVNSAISNSFGFGGVNTSLLFSKYN